MKPPGDAAYSFALSGVDRPPGVQTDALTHSPGDRNSGDSGVGKDRETGDAESDPVGMGVLPRRRYNGPSKRPTNIQ